MEVHVSKDGEYVQAHDIVIKSGYRLRGQVLRSDNKPIADGMRVFLSSKTVSDSQSVGLAPDGKFEFTSLPAGNYTISGSVKGYHENTPQYGPTPFLIDHDIDDITTTIYPDVP